MNGLKMHQYYNPEFVMTCIVAQSNSLKYTLDDMLYAEIGRGLWIFFISLLGGSLFMFVIFSALFERLSLIHI